MPRTKAGGIARTHFPARLQDSTGLTRRLLSIVETTLVDPLEATVEDLEATVAALEPGVFHETEIALRPGGAGGTVYVEPDGGYVEEAIGRPVLIGQAQSDADDDEGAIVNFTARVIDRRRMRVRWCSSRPAPARVRIVYSIGSREE